MSSGEPAASPGEGLGDSAQRAREWARVGEDRVVYDGWVSVIKRSYRLPDGRLAEWDLRGGRETVTVLALTPEGRLVMTRQFRPGPDRVVLTAPGGLLDADESPEQAAERELREETGYEAATTELVVSSIANGTPMLRHVAIARDCVRRHEPALDEFEDVETLLMDLADVRRELRTGGMTGAEQLYLGLDHAGLL